MHPSMPTGRSIHSSVFNVMQIILYIALNDNVGDSAGFCELLIIPTGWDLTVKEFIDLCVYRRRSVTNFRDIVNAMFSNSSVSKLQTFRIVGKHRHRLVPVYMIPIYQV